jgi:membrane protease YdiL (CAAX protease family)
MEPRATRDVGHLEFSVAPAMPSSFCLVQLTPNSTESEMKDKDTLWLYLAIVFVLSYLWQLVIYFTGGVDSMLFPFMMLFPAIVAIAFRLMKREGFRNVGWGLRRWWYVIPALTVPIIVILLVGSFLTASNFAVSSGKPFLFKDGMVEIQKIPLVLGNRTQSIAFFALNFVLSLFVQSLFGSIVTIGEEFGWRGYAQEKLIRKFGLNRGLILLGLIWGYWHLPIGLMGWNFPNHPVLGALLLTPLGTIFIGIYLGWLYLRSRSIWMPTLTHAASNLAFSILAMGMIMSQEGLVLQLSWIAGWGIVAALCLISLNRTKPILWQEAHTSADSSQYV